MLTPRGFAGPNLLAMILFDKFGQHQPLNRQSERYAEKASISACRRWPTRLGPVRYFDIS
jgi:transposase